MSAPRVELADELLATIQAAIDGSDIPRPAAVIVSKDPLAIPSGERHGIVVVTPPSIEFDTWTATTISWPVFVFAGPRDNILAAWQRTDEIVDALTAAGTLSITRAVQVSYTPQSGPEIPGYQLTVMQYTE